MSRYHLKNYISLDLTIRLIKNINVKIYKHFVSISDGNRSNSNHPRYPKCNKVI